MIGKLNHVAIAVRDIGKAAAVYRDVLGADVSAAVPQPDHGVTTVFITLPNTKIELLEPLGEGSPIAKFLERNPDGGMHHVCYEVDDIRAARDALKGRARACLATASRKSARTASRCCSCTRRIFPARWSSWNSAEHAGHDRPRHLFPDLVGGAVRGAAVGRAQPARRRRNRPRHRSGRAGGTEAGPKLMWTTLVSALIFAGCYVVYVDHLVTLQGLRGAVRHAVTARCLRSMARPKRTRAGPKK